MGCGNDSCRGWCDVSAGPLTDSQFCQLRSSSVLPVWGKQVSPPGVGWRGGSRAVVRVQAAAGVALVSMWWPGREKPFSCSLSHYSVSPFTWFSVRHRGALRGHSPCGQRAPVPVERQARSQF